MKIKNKMLLKITILMMTLALTSADMPSSIVQGIGDMRQGRITFAPGTVLGLDDSQKLSIGPKNETLPFFYANENLKEYENSRNTIILGEAQLITGSHIQLNGNELRVRDIFMEYKDEEMRKSYAHDSPHAPGMHFFNALPLIHNSKVFQFIKKMPKGAILHVHNYASVTSHWVISNLTYMSDMLMCFTRDNVTILTFRKNESEHECRNIYLKVSTVREKTGPLFDSWLESKINFMFKWVKSDYNISNGPRPTLEHMFHTIRDVLNYEPAFRAYHWRMLEEMYQDHVMYAEVRMWFYELYNQNKNTIISKEDSIRMLIDIVEQFKKTYPMFLGIKVICTTDRNAERQKVHADFKDFTKWHSLFPNFIIGFDLAGSEEYGKSLHDYVDILHNKPNTASYYFHAGETNLYGTFADDNLIDAILLNTSRIGGGYALMKHPVIAKAIKKNMVPVEVLPISSQVLGLVRDMRNHPGGTFMSQNIPVVISNDYPGFWNARGVSYDYYYAIMSMASSRSGLRTLKQLVVNTIMYANLHTEEKVLAHSKLQEEWNSFVENVLKEYYKNNVH